MSQPKNPLDSIPTHFLHSSLNQLTLRWVLRTWRLDTGSIHRILTLAAKDPKYMGRLGEILNFLQELGYTEEQQIDWLHTPNETTGVKPITTILENDLQWDEESPKQPLKEDHVGERPAPEYIESQRD